MKLSGIVPMVGLLIACLHLQAQPIITQANFPRQADFIDTLHTARFVSIPTEGPDQVWDYSGITLDTITYQHFLDASNDTVLPGASSKIATNFFLGGLPSSGYTYTNLDAQGFWEYGRQWRDTTHDLSLFTGNPQDALSFPAYTEVFNNPIHALKFPTTYLDNWGESRVEIFPYLLTAAAFGLTNTPGTMKREFGQVRTVVGYGHMIIPDEQGLPSDSMEVLQLLVERVYLDSFFLAGSPAPKALLDAFGLTQGNAYGNSFYVFYTPGYGSPVANINTQGTLMGYRPAAIRRIRLSAETAQKPGTLHLSPNPVQSGETVTLQFNQIPEAGQLSLMDITGRTVHTLALPAAQDPVSFTIPAVPPGLYLVGIRNPNGHWTSMSKLQIN